MIEWLNDQTTVVRIASIIVGAGLIHFAIYAVNRLAWALLELVRPPLQPRLRSALSLINSSAIFILYFAMVGMVLAAFGISLTAYFATATVIGLAVGFGSQGVVQDVVTGVGLVFADLCQVGDMVEIGGQSGIVKHIGMRFIVVENALGAEVNIPNRSVTTVINYPKGYVGCVCDVGLVPDEHRPAQFELIEKAMQALQEQFPSIHVRPPVMQDPRTTPLYDFVRVRFYIWPGRGVPIENMFRQLLLQRLKQLDPTYADWMVTVYYEVERKRLEG